MGRDELPLWATAWHKTPLGRVPVASTRLTWRDRMEHVRARTSAFREHFIVLPGLYAVGSPDAGSPVVVSANYKLSFDHLRRNMEDMDAWVLVLDTRGINVWCAAGKGTFGTAEVVARVREAGLDQVVTHRRLILPQLAAPGVAAHEVRQGSGFRVHYGPVRASDLRAYMDAGMKADDEMRRVRFPAMERLILTPMEIRPAMRYLPHFALGAFVLLGAEPEGIIFSSAWHQGGPMVAEAFVSIMAGALVTPMLLPWLPGRAFGLKGYVAGLALAALAAWPLGIYAMGTYIALATLLLFPALASLIAQQFTGSTTYTGPSGVKREIKQWTRVYAGSAIGALLLLIAHKLSSWGVI